MRYVYRCDTCRESSTPTSGRLIEAVRDQHRSVAHPGMVPDGESITPVSGGTVPVTRGQVLAVGLVLALLLFSACERIGF
ncbi:hypothetical protein [Kitasatospora sp. NPDC088548]|uniref:hypothetical protein n=1 Tax=Kitasatospora sp. NPDC088548 TaxID=3364075 RepID=UPI0037F28147